MLIAPISKAEPIKRTSNDSHNHQQQGSHSKSKSWDAIFLEENSDLKKKTVKPTLQESNFNIHKGGASNLEEFLRTKSRITQVTITPSSAKKNAYMEKAKRRIDSSFEFDV